MAAVYWDTHAALALVSPQRLEDTNAEDRVLGITSEQIVGLRNFFAAAIHELAISCKLRQRVAATAILYFRRVYLTHSFCKTDPRLVYVACLYLASKAEEAVISAKHLVSAARKLQPSLFQHYDVKEVLDAEVALLEALDFVLLAHNPYIDLSKLLQASGFEKTLSQTAWGILNETYLLSDVCLMQSPVVIAASCLVLAASVRQLDISAWLSKLEGLDLELVYEIVSQISDAVSSPHHVRLEDVLKMLDSIQTALKARHE